MSRKISKKELDLFKNFEINSAYTLLTSLVNNPDNFKTQLGIFLTIGLTPNLSVILYEYIKDTSYELEIRKSNPEFYENLKKVRNNIHTYNKFGRYTKGSKIYDSNREFFGRNIDDGLDFLRNDVALIYNPDNIIIGSNYFYQHYLFECKTQKEFGDFIKKYSEDLAYNIKKLSKKIKAGVNLSPIEVLLPVNYNQYKFEDTKGEQLLKKSQLPSGIIIRLLSILYELNTIIIFISEIINKDNLKNEKWLYFWTKQLAIVYDESIDNLKNMIDYLPSENKAILLKVLNSDILTDPINEKVQALRNSLHYNSEIEIIKNVSINFKSKALSNIYFSLINVDSVDEFKIFFNNLIENSKELIYQINQLF